MVVPATAEEVAAVVLAAREAGVAVVPRGAGTGLAGG
ncbi:MAG: FAD-binding protein, partial [Candidatus Limnocylindria bacterium]